LDDKNNKYPCFIVNDLAKDKRFANLPVVDGSIAKYRFYAGTPITTSHGINIGSLFFFDDKVRDDLSLGQRKCQYYVANLAEHLMADKYTSPSSTSSKCHEAPGNKARSCRTTPSGVDEQRHCRFSRENFSAELFGRGKFHDI
jgi:hypothetical protein